ncbi:MAG: ACT domain-containing protein, partial [Candidatus Omnitrophota bacterium]|nr:ACT domain-containing protein [Candidatus Omnitrophota bacterium]
AKIFKDLSVGGVNVDTIVQNVSHTRQTDISFTVLKTDLAKAIRITRKVAKKIGAGQVLKDPDICRVSIVGVGMKSHPGAAAKMFETLAEDNINIEMITTSEISISCIFQKKFGETAVKALHEKFGLGKK